MWKILARSIIAATCLVIALSGTAKAQGNSIRGKVRNSSGQNAPHLIVHLETGNGSPVNVTTTTNEGDFSFAGLAETSYIVIISSPDYETVREHVDFVQNASPDSPGESRTVDIVLVPKGESINPRPLSNRVVTGQTVPKAAREALERAAKLASEKKDQEYVATLREAIKAFPEYFDAHLLLAAQLLKENQLDDSISEFEVARKINPKDDRVYQGFGQVLMKQRKFALASQVFGEAARLNPADAMLFLLRGSALLEHALALNPNSSKEAAEEFKTALELAEHSLNKAIELDRKGTAQAHLQLARLYERRGERDRAANEMEEYLKVQPGAKNAAAIREGIKKLRTQDPASKKP
jgi:Tfp pilus assembly protein PilF